MALDQAQSFELCLKELELVQSHIARYDGNGLAIKSWCLSIDSALAAYAVVNQSAFVALMASIITVAFAAIEIVYRCYQSRFIHRAREIEACLQDFSAERYRYALSSAAEKACWSDEIKKAVHRPHFIGFYAMFFILALLLFAALCLGLLPTLPEAFRM